MLDSLIFLLSRHVSGAFDSSPTMLQASARFMASYLLNRANLNVWPFRMDFCGQQLSLGAMARACFLHMQVEFAANITGAGP